MHDNSDDEVDKDNNLRGLYEEEEKAEHNKSNYSEAALSFRKTLNDKVNKFLKEHHCPEIDVNKPLLNV